MTATSRLTPAAQLAMDVILGKPVKGIPIWLINPMEHRMIDRIAGVPEGTYLMKPEPTYRQMLLNAGCCLVDQYIPENPLSMGRSGYRDNKPRGATTGAREIVRDGIPIDSPEAVVDHLEKIVLPGLKKSTVEFDEDRRVRELIEGERAVQAQLGPGMLKVPYGCVSFPALAYGHYGYENYFMAYALYPEVMERFFAAQADKALQNNRAVLRAYREGGLPPLTRLDHDMADSRGTLVDIASLDRIWFPHFARCLEPLLKSDIKLIWHCDGNLSQMVPRLLDVGIKGFQGFQYEDGMDYEAICTMKTREGEPLFIIAGVSVTRTLPHGTPDDVRREMKWLVEKGPRTGLALGGSSSIAPGVPWENLQALVDGFNYYREHGRG
ncbi:MAG: hypothetical protein HY343_06615 [Lentisphaerae bacterium]|nr:hypothetical protein [Lentisphaerota bacterium]